MPLMQKPFSGSQEKLLSPALAGLWRHLQPRASVVVQVEMRPRHADQVHPPVESPVKGKVRRLGVDAVLALVAAGHYQKIFPVLLA